ncbi:MAG TPA: TetR/AcrR family transcriptional regulator [Candidatus Acidoferrum sp.]|nr:TetR/AcrR family transcriptional regulator [Candidatus Acidoferrum sp.]
MLDENVVAHMVRRKIVTETFRRLPPEKKELIYRAAIRLFGTYGYDGLPVDRLCKEAGISKGSFFQYFPSKSHLLEFSILIFDDYLARRMEEVKSRETAVLARDRIAHLYHAAVLNAKLFPAEKIFYLFVTHATAHAGVAVEGIDLERHLSNYVREIIERGEKTGEIRGDIDVNLTAHLVSIIFGALIGREFSGSRTTGRPSGELLVSFLFDGLKR